MLKRGEPYPQVILPEFGGYWIEASEGTPSPTCLEKRAEKEEEGGGDWKGIDEEDSAAGDCGYHLEEMNAAAQVYRKHFLGRVRQPISDT